MLTGVTHVIAQPGVAFALVREKGQVVAFQPGQDVKPGPPAFVTTMRGHAKTVVATDSQKRLWFYDGTQWRGWFESERDAPSIGDRLQEVVETKAGALFVGSQGAAIVPPTLHDWRPLKGLAKITKVTASSDGARVRAQDDQRSLFEMSTSGERTAWTPIRFGETASAVSSLTLNAGADRKEHWACLDSGEIYAFDATGPQLRRRPTRAPASVGDIVGVARSDHGFLVAFRSGHIAKWHGVLSEWAPIKIDGLTTIQRFVAVGPVESPSRYWLLDGKGQLWTCPAPGLNPWKVVEQEVSDIAASGEHLVLVSETRAAVKMYDAQENPTTWFDRARLAKPLGPIVAVSELPGESGVAMLAISDGEQLAVYDPVRRSWHAAEQDFVQLVPTTDRLLARTKKGNVVRVGWQQGLQFEAIATPGRVRELATSGNDQRLAMLLDDGRLLVQDGTAKSRSLIGAQLPADLRDRYVTAADVRGPELVVGFDDGRLFHYDSSARHWENIGQFSQLKRVYLRGNGIWIESGDMNAIDHIVRDGMSWRTESIAKDVRHWHFAGDGIVATTGDTPPDQRKYLAARQPPRSIHAAIGSDGPAADQVVGSHQTSDGLWLHTEQGELSHYHFGDRRWENFTSRIAEAHFIGDDLIVRQDGHLLVGRASAAGQGRRTLTRLAEQVTTVAVDPRTLAYTVEQGVRVLSYPEQKERWRQDYNAAWADSPQKPHVAAADGDELWVVGDRNSAATYHWPSRRWHRVGDLPWRPEKLQVLNRRAIAINAERSLVRLVRGEVQAPETVTEKTFDAGGSQWRIESHGRIVDAQASELTEEVLGPDLAVVRLFETPKGVWFETSDGALITTPPRFKVVRLCESTRRERSSNGPRGRRFSSLLRSRTGQAAHSSRGDDR